jgi:hypothetical protein
MRLQGGSSTRRSQQQLVARTAKLALRRGGTYLVVSIDMALCVKLCVLCIDIESFHRFMDVSYWSKAVFNLITVVCVTKLPKLPLKFCFSRQITETSLHRLSHESVLVE